MKPSIKHHHGESRINQYHANKTVHSVYQYSDNPSRLSGKVNVASVSRQRKKKVDKTFIWFMSIMVAVLFVAFYLKDRNRTACWGCVAVQLVIAIAFKHQMNKSEALKAKSRG